MRLEHGIVAFAGESGLGKSTLARFLAEGGGARVELASDDILPVSTHGERTRVHPDYPQFKLPATQQPPASLGHEHLPLRAVYVLAHTASGNTSVETARLGSAAGALALAGNTVGSRLFGRSLLARHLAFCARMAGFTPVYRLEYPRQRDRLPQVKEAIERSLAALP